MFEGWHDRSGAVCVADGATPAQGRKAAGLAGDADQLNGFAVRPAAPRCNAAQRVCSAFRSSVHCCCGSVALCASQCEHCAKVLPSRKGLVNHKRHCRPIVEPEPSRRFSVCADELPLLSLAERHVACRMQRAMHNVQPMQRAPYAM